MEGVSPAETILIVFKLIEHLATHSVIHLCDFRQFVVLKHAMGMRIDPRVYLANISSEKKRPAAGHCIALLSFCKQKKK